MCLHMCRTFTTRHIFLDKKNDLGTEVISSLTETFGISLCCGFIPLIGHMRPLIIPKYLLSFKSFTL